MSQCNAACVLCDREDDTWQGMEAASTLSPDLFFKICSQLHWGVAIQMRNNEELVWYTQSLPCSCQGWGGTRYRLSNLLWG